MANGLSQKIKEVCNIDCDKNCRAIYQIFNGNLLNSKRERLTEIIILAAQHYSSAKEEEKKRMFLELGPTLKECSNYNCFAPFILKEFGGGKKLEDYLIKQEAALEDFKWERGITEEGDAWNVWITEKELDGMTNSDRFNRNYFQKYFN